MSSPIVPLDTGKTHRRPPFTIRSSPVSLSIPNTEVVAQSPSNHQRVSAWKPNGDCLEMVIGYADRSTRGRLMRVCAAIQYTTAPPFYRIMTARLVESLSTRLRENVGQAVHVFESADREDDGVVRRGFRPVFKLAEQPSLTSTLSPGREGSSRLCPALKHTEVMDLRGLEQYWNGPIYWEQLLSETKIDTIVYGYKGPECPCYRCASTASLVVRSVVIDWRSHVSTLYRATPICHAAKARPVPAEAVILFPIRMVYEAIISQLVSCRLFGMARALWDTAWIVLYPDWTPLPTAQTSNRNLLLNHLWQDIVLLCARASTKATIVGLEQAQDRSCDRQRSNAPPIPEKCAPGIFEIGMESLKKYGWPASERHIPAVSLITLEQFKQTHMCDHELFGDKLDAWRCPPPGKTHKQFW